MAGFGMVLPVLPLSARSFGVGYGAASRRRREQRAHLRARGTELAGEA